MDKKIINRLRVTSQNSGLKKPYKSSRANAWKIAAETAQLPAANVGSVNFADIIQDYRFIYQDIPQPQVTHINTEGFTLSANQTGYISAVDCAAEPATATEEEVLRRREERFLREFTDTPVDCEPF